MKIEFKKAVLPREVKALLAFDAKVFPAADRFDAGYWRACESHWLIVDRKKIGCCAFEKDIDFHDSLGNAPRREGSLYISTTGVLPRYQNRGFGPLIKAWQVAYARYYGFNRIITSCRKSNSRMIAMNRQFGFRIVRTIPRYYSEPVEPAVLMEHAT